MKKLVRLMGVSMALAAGTAAAESMTTTVSFNRTNAQTAEGAAQLYGKLKDAADNLCGRMVSYRRMYADQYRACVSAALNEAVTGAGVPQVSLLHEDHNALHALLMK
ncbi:MAG: UrcA family protein [Steroidobacteraceae bacterium]